VTLLLRHPYPRRLLTVPAVFGLLFLLLTLLPLWVFAAAFVSPWLPGRLRALRLLWFLVVYLVLQAVGLLAAAALWVGSGFGHRLSRETFCRVHYRLLEVLLGVLMRSARRLFRLRLVVEADPPPDEQPQVPHDDPRPMVVLSRHAGPMDSFLLVHELLTEYGRHPRIVLKSTLQWDPLIDVLLNRVPTRFIATARAGVAATIGELAGDLGPQDAVVIFPEGANYTRARRERGIERLEQEGRHEQAARARGLRHVLPPRPAGTLSAIGAAVGADVVFVAHSGLEQLQTISDVWRGLPMDADVRARLWTVPAEDVPRGTEARTAWLFAWWEQLDEWIDAAHRQGPFVG
jgi:1-acyl-sn-glycerol-3-phosphate acyltransferase